MIKKNLKGKTVSALILVLVVSLSLAGCSGSNYETKPDYAITEQVSMRFMEAYMQGDIEKAMQEVAEEAILSTETGQMKGKETIAEMLRINIDKENKVEIADQKKLDNSKIVMTINNRIPLFQLAGVEVIQTKEIFEVQDGKIVEWEIKNKKESMDLIEKMASGSTGLEVEVKDDQIVVKRVVAKTPADYAEIKSKDIIQSINGVTLQEMKYGADEIPYRMIGEVGSKVEFKIQSGTEVRTVNLKRINLNEDQ